MYVPNNDDLLVWHVSAHGPVEGHVGRSHPVFNKGKHTEGWNRKSSYVLKPCFKIDQPRPLFHLLPSFQTHITNFTTNMYVKKCPSSIWCRDLNSRPLEHESPPITTRPGLPPHRNFVFVVYSQRPKDLVITLFLVFLLALVLNTW